MSDPSTKQAELIVLTPAERTLRQCTMISWFFGFTFLFANAVVTRQLFPALVILPLSLSACMGLFRVYGHGPVGIANMLLEAFMALFLLSILIPSWIFNAQEARILAHGGRYFHGHRINEAANVVAPVATLMPAINMVIHFFLFFKELRVQHPSLKLPRALEFLNEPFVAPRFCPHCNGDLGSSFPRGVRRDPSNDSSEGHLVTSHQEKAENPDDMESTYQEPRPSSEAETARLLVDMN